MATTGRPYWWRARERRATDVSNAGLHDASSVSLRWRVMLRPCRWWPMVVVLMAVAVYVVVSRALYQDIDNQLQTRARLLIESGSLAADPARPSRAPLFRRQRDAGEPGPRHYATNQEGQTLPLGQPEKEVIQGQLLWSLRTTNYQRVLAIHLSNGSSLADLQEHGAHQQGAQQIGDHPADRRRARHGGGGDRGRTVARTGLRPVAR